MNDLNKQRAWLRAALGRVGVWSIAFDFQPVAREWEALAELERVGYPALWFAESWRSKEALSHAALLLARSERIVVVTGIANIWARDPAAMAAAGRTLNDAFPRRFVLGIGVSHRTTVDQRGVHQYRRPYARMREYLDAMEGAAYAMDPAPDLPPVILATLGPKMLELAAERAAGAHSYFVPVEHTKQAREILGGDPFLAPEQAVVLETDPSKARDIARGHMSRYLTLENYIRNLLRLGFSEEDVTQSSDRLVDAIVAWGSADTVAARIKEHHDAGADHVAVQVLSGDPSQLPIAQLEELAAQFSGTSR